MIRWGQNLTQFYIQMYSIAAQFLSYKLDIPRAYHCQWKEDRFI